MKNEGLGTMSMAHSNGKSFFRNTAKNVLRKLGLLEYAKKLLRRGDAGLYENSIGNTKEIEGGSQKHEGNPQGLEKVTQDVEGDTRNYEHEYRVFREEFQSEKLPKLALFKPKYPYGEIAVIYGAKTGAQTEERLARFCEQEGFTSMDMNGATVLSTLEPNTDMNGTRYIFSGITRWQDKLIVGESDIKKHGIAASELREGIGEFELLLFDGQRLELSTDYFGMCQWYYYKSDDGFFVAATSYHLLLLTLKTLGTKLKLNTKKVIAGIAFFCFTCESSFTEEMDIEQCYELPLDQRIVIQPDLAPIFENTSLYQKTRFPEPYTEETYEKYLFQVKDELIANVRAAFEHPGFEYILCDLTGGLDSRTVFAAVTNLPHSLTQKTRINTYTSSAEDFEIANTIVNAFDLTWNDIPREKSYDGIGLFGETLYQAPQSHNLGTYYIIQMMPKFFENKTTLHLTGGFGDALYHQVYFWADYSKNGRTFFEQFGKTYDVPHSSTAREYFLEYLQNSILSMPGKTIEAKLEMFYIYYRTRHHFKTKYVKQSPRWMPLQSKAALQCYSMCLAHSVDDRFEFDMISILNPFLANFPYEKGKGNKYNLYLSNHLDRLYGKGYPRADMALDHNTDKWKGTTQESIFLPDQETVKRHRKETQAWYESEQMMLSALKEFLDHSEEFEELGLPMYRYFVNDRHEKKFEKGHHVETMRINRLLSAYWQIKLIEDF